MRVLGFSPDGRRFAIEETGTKDGSAFPYARISVFGPGGGVMERVIEEDSAGEDEALAATRAAARPLMEAAGGVTAPAILLDSHDTARAGTALLPMDVPPVRQEAETQLALRHPALGGSAHLVLSERPSKDARCHVHDDPAVEPVIRLEREEVSAVLLDGMADPSVIYCPSRFGLVAAYLHDEAGAKALAVVFQAFPLGFEGPDRRFFAVIAPVGK